VSCRPFTPEDLCRPNPCGPNAYCKPGIDNRTGEDRPVCLCNEGYRGNGVTGCTRGECTSLQHNTCPNDRACYDSSCIDPCGPTFCGGSPCCNPTANCRAVDHLAECSCPPGTEGEPRAGRGGTCRRSNFVFLPDTWWSYVILCDPWLSKQGIIRLSHNSGPQTHVPASPSEAEVWVDEALCQPLTQATFVNRTPVARTPNVTWELIVEGTQGLSVLAREGTLVTPCAFA